VREHAMYSQLASWCMSAAFVARHCSIALCHHRASRPCIAS
jgi:hypothetical protein